MKRDLLIALLLYARDPRCRWHYHEVRRESRSHPVSPFERPEVHIEPAVCRLLGVP